MIQLKLVHIHITGKKNTQYQCFNKITHIFFLQKKTRPHIVTQSVIKEQVLSLFLLCLNSSHTYMIKDSWQSTSHYIYIPTSRKVRKGKGICIIFLRGLAISSMKLFSLNHRDQNLATWSCIIIIQAGSLDFNLRSNVLISKLGVGN